jgi:methionyl-tRNA synthetase
MSKSLGNVVNVDDLLAKYPVEAIRFYFIMETIWGEDIKFNEGRIKELYNNRLLKEFGNLFQRVFALVKPLESSINTQLSEFDFATKKLEFNKKIKDYITTYNHQKYKEEFQNLCQIANKELTLNKPWDKSVGQKHKIIILINQLIYLNFIMELLSPIMPTKIDTLRGFFGWSLDNSIKLSIQVDKIKAFNSI